MKTRLLLTILIIVGGSFLHAGEKPMHGGAGYSVHKCAHCMNAEQLKQLKKLAVSGGEKGEGELQRYPLYPHAGIFGEDIYLGNYVDLDPTSGIGDVFCGDISYNGHRGIDTSVPTFQYQDGGVPIFAVLDGRVTIARDGEPDRNTVWANQTSNYVRINHGDDHVTTYLHMKRGSVAVAAGDQVLAGQQIGLVGSSGVSTWPHLHFETTYQGQVVEPFTGDCRGTESLWMEQPADGPPTFIREFTLTEQDLSTWAGPPGDTSNQGTFELGTNTFFFWINLLRMSPDPNYTYRLVDPEGAVIDQQAAAFSGIFRWSWWWWGRTVEFTTIGTHHIELLLDGEVKVRAPLEVVPTGAPRPNRPPFDAEFSFLPGGVGPNTVPMVRRTSFEVIDDPDYDLVRYRYVWSVNGEVRRDVTTAAMADAFPRGIAVTGDVLSCRITPTDDQAEATTQTLTTTVFEPYADWATRHGLDALSFDGDADGDAIRNGFEYTLGMDPMNADGLPSHQIANDGILWQLPRSPVGDPAVSLVMEYSTDLKNWQSLPEQRQGDISTFQAPAAAIRQFARLRATHAPTGQSATVPASAVLP